MAAAPLTERVANEALGLELGNLNELDPQLALQAIAQAKARLLKQLQSLHVAEAVMQGKLGGEQHGEDAAGWAKLHASGNTAAASHELHKVPGPKANDSMQPPDNMARLANSLAALAQAQQQQAQQLVPSSISQSSVSVQSSVQSSLPQGTPVANTVGVDAEMLRRALAGTVPLDDDHHGHGHGWSKAGQMSTGMMRSHAAPNPQMTMPFSGIRPAAPMPQPLSQPLFQAQALDPQLAAAYAAANGVVGQLPGGVPAAPGWGGLYDLDAADAASLGRSIGAATPVAAASSQMSGMLQGASLPTTQLQPLQHLGSIHTASISLPPGLPTLSASGLSSMVSPLQPLAHRHSGNGANGRRQAAMQGMDPAMLNLLLSGQMAGGAAALHGMPGDMGALNAALQAAAAPQAASSGSGGSGKRSGASRRRKAKMYQALNAMVQSVLDESGGEASPETTLLGANTASLSAALGNLAHKHGAQPAAVTNWLQQRLQQHQQQKHVRSGAGEGAQDPGHLSLGGGMPTLSALQCGHQSLPAGLLVGSLHQEGDSSSAGNSGRLGPLGSALGTGSTGSGLVPFSLRDKAGQEGAGGEGGAAGVCGSPAGAADATHDAGDSLAHLMQPLALSGGSTVPARLGLALGGAAPLQ